MAWHNSFVEDQLLVADVDLIPDASAEAKAWPGGIGVLEPGQPYRVEPLQPATAARAVEKPQG